MLGGDRILPQGQRGRGAVSGHGEATELSDASNALGWHHDGATVCTMAVALSSAGEHFDGGELQVRDRQQGRELLHTVSDLRRGDVVAWRGWDVHRVRPVRSGRRRVLVAEWWLGTGCSEADPRPRDSEEAILRVLQSHGDSAQLHTILGADLAERGDLAGAEKSLRTAVELDPRHLEAQHGLAYVLAQRGDRAGAEEGLRAVLRLDPQQPKVLYNLGKALAERGDFAGAEKTFREALRLDPAAAALHYALAVTLSSLGDAAGAEASYQAAVRLGQQREVPRDGLDSPSQVQAAVPTAPSPNGTPGPMGAPRRAPPSRKVPTAPPRVPPRAPQRSPLGAPPGAPPGTPAAAPPGMPPGSWLRSRG
ncbi:unnamed protein product [Prorocentrum cordatum]|uniref:Prolyl 4-hydroxylase alpha subunit Fe(2+) 2OG dioxygenase domain-containing protein n=1 Tax=Prorocentrum cordatum TaxID=2364126 RepID=A0ABN9QR29_9DINO|nr:unnamed protein product [Polarella glacialis]